MKNAPLNRGGKLNKGSISAAVLSMAVMMSGCTMIPDYHRPVSATAAQYPQDARAAQDKDANKHDIDAAKLDWRDFYRDPALCKLIEMALENNRDLRVSILNVESARAQYRIQRADLLPTLSAGASGDTIRYPQSVSPSGYAETTHDYQVDGAVASYEVDLFGRVKSLSQQALQIYFSKEEARKAAQIALISEVATAWLTYQADSNLRDVSVQTLRNQQAAFKITSSTYRYGTGSLLDVTQAETSVRTAQSNVAAYERQAKQDVNALTLLVGAPLPKDLLATHSLADIHLNDELAPGLPSDLIARRPDIAEAEDNLKAANANIGAARAAFFPRITLTASGGTASASLSGLFDPGSAAWSFAPNISVPIFDYGRNQANLKVAKVARDIQVATYQKAVQTAFREVADALDGIDTYDRQQHAQSLLVDASDRAYRLSNERYGDGVAGYLDVLVSQRALYTAQQDLIKIQLAHATDTLTLYTALGGGWNSASQKAPLKVKVKNGSIDG